jgi:hypothetical protein
MAASVRARRAVVDAATGGEDECRNGGHRAMSRAREMVSTRAAAMLPGTAPKAELPLGGVTGPLENGY